MPKKGWLLVCFQSNQTKEEVIFRKINMEQFLSQRNRLRIVEMYKNITWKFGLVIYSVYFVWF